MRLKEIPEVLVRSVMSLYKGAKTRVRVELSEEFEVNVGMHQGSVLSPYLSAVVVDVVTEFARQGALNELLYADVLVLMSETIEGLKNEVETAREVTYLGDRVSAGGGCEAAVTARIRCGWAKPKECSKLLYSRRFPLRLKCTVNRSHVRTAILYGSEAW